MIGRAPTAEDLGRIVSILGEVLGERHRQIVDLGYDNLHDDMHDVDDMTMYVRKYAGRADRHASLEVDVSLPQIRADLIKAAATAVAAVARIDREGAS